MAVFLVGAALSPGNQDFEAKWADWLRANHAGLLGPEIRGDVLTAPSSVPLVVTPALQDEGQWQATGPLVGGRPAMYVAQFRADDV